MPQISPNESPSAVEVPCPLCGSEEWKLYVLAPSHYGPEKHSVTKCRHCRMVYTNPQSTTYTTEVENRGALDRHFEPSRLAAQRRHARFLIELLRPHVAGRDLLDYGCGAGVVVDAANRAGWNAKGYDLNTGLVARANEHWGSNALFSGPPGEFVARFPASFDAIISFQVFEHLQHPVDVGRQVVSMLKPGGIVLIDVPYLHQPGEWISRGKTLDPTSHWCHFSKATLAALIDRIGCDLVYLNAAPSLVKHYHRAGLDELCYSLGRLTKSILPPIGTGVCAIGRKRCS